MQGYSLGGENREKIQVPEREREREREREKRERERQQGGCESGWSRIRRTKKDTMLDGSTGRSSEKLIG